MIFLYLSSGCGELELRHDPFNFIEILEKKHGFQASDGPPDRTESRFTLYNFSAPQVFFKGFYVTRKKPQKQFTCGAKCKNIRLFPLVRKSKTFVCFHSKVDLKTALSTS